MNLSGLPTAPASAFTESDEVLLARMVRSSQTSSRMRNTSVLMPKSSNTASMTKSVSGEMFSVPTTPVIRPLMPSTCASEKIRLSTASPRNSEMMSWPRSTHCCSRSTIWTSNCSCALFWAIPDPMLPAPMMAMLSTGRMLGRPASRPSMQRKGP